MVSTSPMLLPVIEARMHYVAPMAEAPFIDVGARENSRISLDPRLVDIIDARPLVGSLSLDVQGFRLIDHKTQLTRADFHDLDVVLGLYLREMEAIVQAETGADLVISARAPIIRLNCPDAEARGAIQPAPLAHSDYTRNTLGKQLRHEVPADAEAFKRYRRVVAYQTWRAISPPPQDSSLAICDARTVDPADRVLSTFATEVPVKETLEFYMYRHNPAHRWHYFSNLTIDELLLFKGFEGDAPSCMNVLHGGFSPAVPPPGAHPRESIETRTFTFFRD